MRTQDELIAIADQIETSFRESDLNAAEVLMVMGLLSGFINQTYTMMHFAKEDDEHEENYICPDCEAELMGEPKPSENKENE